MLRSLHLENMAVIKCADIDFDGGFTVLTGETGSGKSIIIDSLNMLSGAKISRDTVRSGEERAIAEALFDGLSEADIKKLSALSVDASDGEVMLSCTLTADGKCAYKVNGRSVTRTLIRQISRILISIHSQSDTASFSGAEAYISMLDSFADDRKELSEYRVAFEELSEYRRALARIKTDDASRERERDMLEYQIKDIDSKKLKIGEEEALEDEKKRLLSAERINKNVRFVQKALSTSEKGSAEYLVSRSAQALLQLSDVIPEMREYSEKLEEIASEITDIAERMREYEDDSSESATERIDKIESRLDAISTLKRRYGKDIESILAFRVDAAARLDEIENADSLAEEYTEKIKTAEKRAGALAAVLTEIRREAAKHASEKIEEVLEYLDMPSVEFEIRVSPSEDFDEYGLDLVEFMISTNVGECKKPMSDIVSGGEMSRIMLALRSVMNEKDGVGCSVYDEIDTGISGKTSRKIGLMLLDISKSSQIISVTHSAQIATLSDHHLLIAKQEKDGRVYTATKSLDQNERIEEAARILGGINITEAQREAAREMLSDRSK